MDKPLKCNNCGKFFSCEDDLRIMFEDEKGRVFPSPPKGDSEIIKACDVCRTDGFLVDIVLEDVQERIDSMNEEDKAKLSDGYHTFGDLYEHRHRLFIALMECQSILDSERGYEFRADPWKSMQHSDGSVMPGWFVAGMKNCEGKMFTYHLPIRLWDDLSVNVLNFAPPWDGHSSKDVLERLQKF